MGGEKSTRDREAKCILGGESGQFLLYCDFIHKLRERIQWEEEAG